MACYCKNLNAERSIIFCGSLFSLSKATSLCSVCDQFCALGRRIFLFLQVSGIQWQVFKNKKFLSKRPKKPKEQKNIKEGVLVEESKYNSRNTQLWPHNVTWLSFWWCQLPVQIFAVSRADDAEFRCGLVMLKISLDGSFRCGIFC